MNDLITDAPVGLALCDMDGNLSYVNGTFARMLGYTIPDTLKLDYWQITPWFFEKDEDYQLRLLQKKGQYGPYVKAFQHKKEHLVPVELNGRMVRHEGKPMIWSAVQSLPPRRFVEALLFADRDLSRLWEAPVGNGAAMPKDAQAVTEILRTFVKVRHGRLRKSDATQNIFRPSQRPRDRRTNHVDHARA